MSFMKPNIDSQSMHLVDTYIYIKFCITKNITRNELLNTRNFNIVYNAKENLFSINLVNRAKFFLSFVADKSDELLEKRAPTCRFMSVKFDHLNNASVVEKYSIETIKCDVKKYSLDFRLVRRDSYDFSLDENDEIFLVLEYTIMY